MHHSSQYENMIIASSTFHGHILQFAAEQWVRICSIEIARDRFMETSECKLGGINGELIDIISDIAGNRQFYHHGKYNLKISNLIEEIIDQRLPNLVESYFIKGKCFELLSLQWDTFTNDEAKQDASRILTRVDIELMDNMGNYIQKNIRDGVTINDLKKQFLVSEKKIQQLFKLLYNLTFKEYVNDYRLSKAYELLKQPHNRVSDVVYSIGLNNRSYFTRIFKARFGVTPSELPERNK